MGRKGRPAETGISASGQYNAHFSDNHSTACDTGRHSDGHPCASLSALVAHVPTAAEDIDHTAAFGRHVADRPPLILVEHGIRHEAIPPELRGDVVLVDFRRPAIAITAEQPVAGRVVVLVAHHTTRCDIDARKMELRLLGASHIESCRIEPTHRAAGGSR